MNSARADNIWEGDPGDNWRYASNWSNGVPDSGTNVRLNNGNLANVNTDQACKNLYLAYDEYTAGVLTIKNAATLSVTNDTYVGRGGTATLRIEDGARLENDFGYIGYAVESTGTATVDGTDSTWRCTSDLIVAHSGTGTLYITNGGKVNSYSGIIGAAADDSNRSNGEATVDGTDSWWKCATGDMIVGYQGDGKLTISNGGKVTCLKGWVGCEEGSDGTAIVTQANSLWECTEGMHVGSEGTGRLTVQGGGQVTGTNGHIGYNETGVGYVTVKGAGSNWTCDGMLIVGHEGTGRLTIENGGTVVNTGRAFLADEADSFGKVVITGSGSTWTCQDLLWTGDADNGDGGRAVIEITNGGALLADSDILLSVENNADTTVTVDGDGSRMISGGNVTVGGGGYADVTVQNGGYAESSNLSVASWSGSENSALTIDGAGSSWVVNNAFYVNNTNAANITNGGQLTSSTMELGGSVSYDSTLTVNGDGSTVENTENTIVASWGEGHLKVQNGAAVITGDRAMLATQDNSTATAVVTGEGSTWTASNFFVGGNQASGSTGSSALITVKDGGTLEATGIKLWNNGAIVLNGGTISTKNFNRQKGTFTWTAGTVHFTNEFHINPDQVFGDTINVVTDQILEVDQILEIATGGTLTIGGGDVVATSFVVNDAGVFNFNEGSLTVSGGRFNHNSTNLFVGGSNANKTAVLSLDDVNLPTTYDQIRIGTSGNGVINVLNGTNLETTGNLHIGHNDSGELLISGAGSSVEADGITRIGYNASGTLNITDGGTLTSDSAIIGCNLTTLGFPVVGTATVEGTDSLWDCGSELLVGDLGVGYLTILDGGTVTSTDAVIGAQTGAQGYVDIQNGQSTWTTTGDMFLGGTASGRGGLGVVTVQQGKVNVDGTLKLWASGALAVSGGTTTVGSFDNSEGGTLDFTNGTLAVRGGTFDFGTTDLTVSASQSGKSTTLVLDNATQVGSFTNICIGDSYQGVLELSGGTTLTCTGNANIGNESSSGGLVTVQGSSTVLDCEGQLRMGSAGTGLINLDDYGKVLCDSAVLGYAATGYGWITIRENATLESESYLTIGREGSGAMILQSGGQVIAHGNASVARMTGSTGTLSLTGDGTNFTCDGDLYVGGSDSAAGGTATVTVTDGSMDVGGMLKLWSGSTLAISAGETTVGSFDNSAGGTFNFTNGLLTVSGGTFDSGTADLIVSAGASDDYPILVLDDVTPAASYTNLCVGDSHDGELILAGGTTLASTGNANVGNEDGSNGLFSVQDSGTVLDCDGQLNMGKAGSGLMTIMDSGKVSCDSCVLGYDATGAGWMMLQEYATLESANYLTIGRNGTGVLRLNSGTTVTTGGNTSVARNSGSAGSLILDGDGANFTCGGDFYAGGSDSTAGGTATVIVADGSMNVAQNLLLWGSNEIFVKQGTLTTGTLEGNGTILIADATASVALTLGSTTDATFNGDITDYNSASGSVRKVGSNKQTLAGSLTYTGATFVDEGVLVLDNGLASAGDVITIADGAKLKSGADIARDIINEGDFVATASLSLHEQFENNGTVKGPGGNDWLTCLAKVTGAGDFEGNVMFSGAFSPGNSPAAVSLENVRFDATAVLRMEIGGIIAGDDYDQLIVSDTAELAGTLKLFLIDDYELEEGQTYQLISGTIENTFDQVVNLPEMWAIDYRTDGVYLTSSIPEPSTVTILLGSFFTILSHRKKKRTEEKTA